MLSNVCLSTRSLSRSLVVNREPQLKLSASHSNSIKCFDNILRVWFISINFLLLIWKQSRPTKTKNKKYVWNKITSSLIKVIVREKGSNALLAYTRAHVPLHVTTKMKGASYGYIYHPKPKPLRRQVQISVIRS